MKAPLECEITNFLSILQSLNNYRMCVCVSVCVCVCICFYPIGHTSFCRYNTFVMLSLHSSPCQRAISNSYKPQACGEKHRR